MGVSEERILDGTPNDLKPFDDAYKLRQKVVDENMWMNNLYTFNAVLVAIDKALNGKKSKNEYFEKPLLQMKEEKEDKELSENEKKNQRNNLLYALQIMQINFENNHKK